MECQKCNVVLDADSKFCTECGNNLTDGLTNEKETQQDSFLPIFNT